MKKILLAVLSLAVLLAGCGPRQAGPQPPEPADPLRLETLSVEFAADGGAELLPALNRLPGALKTALAEAGVEAETIRVTLASSQDAAARAVGQGGVDVSFLSAEGYVGAEAGGVPVLADAGAVSRMENWADALPGQEGLLWVGPSEYGRALAGRPSPTWEELDHARWGVLEPENALGNRYLSLWLADRCEGNTLSDLSQVTVYDSYEKLLRAAAADEIDVFPCTWEAISELESAWTQEPGRSDEAGYQGLGRERPLREEVTVLGTLNRWISRVAVVREDETLQGPVFTAALRRALEALSEDPDLTLLAGASHFAPVTDGDLNPLRRLLTIEE